jgi:hypothetical protein
MIILTTCLVAVIFYVLAKEIKKLHNMNVESNRLQYDIELTLRRH